ncbi:MAG: FAD-dependent oxidoreductase [Dehalococcoidia bacterium]|jgi:2,4-dienoyl-CoA reductase-like NADH-dependent reductase (Old Yellow Enzyme family)/thioredoxin reductase|nr:FAD-dependent oxidoreductase [Dehalococcoidia bacterium]
MAGAGSLLFSPVRIGGLEVKNRTVMPPMGTNMCAEGFITPRLQEYYGARAEGGVGLVIVEGSCLDTVAAKAMPRQVAIDHDRFLIGLRGLAETIHSGGARAAIQLMHAGVAASARVTPNPLAPSPFTMPDGRTTREMTPDDMALVAEQHATAARRAQEAGFDGVELHAAHRYLLAAFLSPSTNRRQDGYGGQVPNRARFVVEVLRRVKEAVGPDYPVWVRINGQEWMPDGLSNEDAVLIGGLMEEAGAAAVHISAWGVKNQRQQASLPTVPGGLLSLTDAVKKSLRIPVIAVGLMSPEIGEAALKEGRADLIAFGRGLIADPELPRKVAEGRPEDIRPCIACMNCRDGLLVGKDIECQVNPAVGWEADWHIARSDTPKKILVIGGGPGGMEAARTAAIRGHQVTLWEKAPRLGGQLIQAAVPPHKERMAPLLPYYEAQLNKLGAKVEMGREAGADDILSASPDAVVAATGVEPVVPAIPGVNNPRVVLAAEVLLGTAQVGRRVAVIGGEMVGCEVGEVMAEQGKSVTVMRRGEKMAQKVTPSIRELVLIRLGGLGVRLLTGVSYEGITDKGLAITVAGKQELIEADTIVLAAGASPAKLIETEGIVLKEIGDCVEPRGLKEAISEGWAAALAL